MGMATVGPGKCAGCGDNHWLGEPCDKKDRKILSLKKQLAALDAEIADLDAKIERLQYELHGPSNC
jgi:peptidoglycan hydrolase CwlO-like protein